MQQVEPSWDSNVIHLDGEQDQWSPAFGYSVGVSGHTIVVSSYGENAEIDYANDAIGGDVGSAYVFTRSSSDPPNWAPRAWLTVRDEHPSNLMGSSCAIDGDTIAVGAQNQDTDSHGAVHVFYRDVPGDPNSGWTQVEKLRGEHDLPHGQANDVQLKLGASVDIYGDVIIAGGVMGNVGSAGAAYIFTRDRPGVSSSTWTQRDRIFTGVANDHLGARGVVVHGDLAMIAGGGNPDDGSPASFVRVYRLPCPERDITDPNTCSCDDLMAINGFKIADEFSSSSSPSSGCYGPAPTYKYTEPSPPAPLPSFRFAVDAPSKTGYGYFGDCLCLCKGEQVANGTIDVTDDQGGVGFSFSKCVDEGPEECGDMATEGYIDACDVNFTTTWSYVPTYTGACNPGYEGTNCQTASACTNSLDSTKDGSDGIIHCGEHGIVGGTTGSCTCTCDPGWEGSGCETASACTNSSISTKDGSDGIIHCGEHGIVGGTTGSCTCTCDPGWDGSGCETASACTATLRSRPRMEATVVSIAESTASSVAPPGRARVHATLGGMEAAVRQPARAPTLRSRPRMEATVVSIAESTASSVAPPGRARVHATLGGREAAVRRLQTLQPRRRIRARVEAPPTSTETASATATPTRPILQGTSPVATETEGLRCHLG